jgi:hypothetical protein
MTKMNNNVLLANIDKIHTTELGAKRIKRNCCLDVDDVVNWCVAKIKDSKSVIVRRGKNWYVKSTAPGFGNYEITVNAYSYTIITAHIISNLSG